MSASDVSRDRLEAILAWGVVAGREVVSWELKSRNFVIGSSGQ